MLKKIHNSRAVSRIYRALPFLKRSADRVYSIYLGSGSLMTRRGYWYLHSIMKYLGRDCKLLHKKRILRTRLPVDGDNIIDIEPGRIRSMFPPGARQHPGAGIRDGNWDRHTIEITRASVHDKTNGEEEAVFPAEAPVEVAIGRSGNVILGGNLPHLLEAREAKTGPIKAVVTCRHYRWARFRQEVYDYSREQPKGTYQMQLHPDLRAIHSHRRDDRWEMITGNLPVQSGSVLDIGSNWGYFCHQFEDLGFTCHAAENNYRWLYFLRKLRDVEGKTFRIIPGSIFDIKRKEFDIVLALSIFHHFLREEGLYRKFTRLLGELEMKYMFFEPHQTGHGFPGAFTDYDEDGFAEFILENSCLNHRKLLGRTELGRNLYLLSA